MTLSPNPPAKGQGAASPLFNLLWVQGLAIVAVLVLYTLLPRLSIGAAILVQAVLAAVLSRWLFRQPWWWPWIHLLFLPSALALSRMGLPPVWYLCGLVLLLMLFGRAWQGRVPFFLSSTAALKALDELLPREERLHFVDLGCGNGRVLAAVKRLRPSWRVTGVEAAWLPYLWSSLRLSVYGSESKVIRADFWKFSVADADVVYTYLSPTPMPRVWKKLLLEMKQGCLISYRFALPVVAPDRSLPLPDGSSLHRWMIPRNENDASAH